MFLGYQGDKIVLAVETKEKLENIPFIEITKIEETEYDYVNWNGAFIKKTLAFSGPEEIAKKRQEKYSETTDLFLLNNLENVTTLDELLTLIADWKDLKQKIKSELSYS